MNKLFNTIVDEEGIVRRETSESEARGKFVSSCTQCLYLLFKKIERSCFNTKRILLFNFLKSLTNRESTKSFLKVSQEIQINRWFKWIHASPDLSNCQWWKTWILKKTSSNYGYFLLNRFTNTHTKLWLDFRIHIQKFPLKWQKMYPICQKSDLIRNPISMLRVFYHCSPCWCLY